MDISRVQIDRSPMRIGQFMCMKESFIMGSGREYIAEGVEEYLRQHLVSLRPKHFAAGRLPGVVQGRIVDWPGMQ